MMPAITAHCGRKAWAVLLTAITLALSSGLGDPAVLVSL